MAYTVFMPKPSDVVRNAILGSKMSRYEIAQRTGIAESTLSRFVAGKGLNSHSIDTLAEFLGLQMTRKGTTQVRVTKKEK